MANVVLLTGCNTVFGLVIAKKFLDNDWSVVGIDKEHECIEKIEKLDYVQGDICKRKDREKILNMAVEKYGKIAALVNATDTQPKISTDLLQITEENFDNAIENTLKGTFFFSQLVAKRMMKQRKNYEICGRIINISSMYAYFTSTDYGAHCISQASISSMTKVFAHRLAVEGIIVNEIRPGMMEAALGDEEEKKYKKYKDDGFIPLDRWGTSWYVADVAFFLCNDNLTYIVGQSIDVDGGIHLRKL